MRQLIAVLDPEVVLREQGGAKRAGATALVRGANAVASRTILFARPDAQVLPALVNDGTGVVVLVGGECVSVMSFTVVDSRIVEVAALAARIASARPVVAWRLVLQP